MLSIATIILFMIAGIAATLVLVDGFIRGKARYAELQQAIAHGNSQRLVTVQIHGTRQTKAYSRPAAVAKVVCSPVLKATPQFGVAA